MADSLKNELESRFFSPCVKTARKTLVFPVSVAMKLFHQEKQGTKIVRVTHQ